MCRNIHASSGAASRKRSAARTRGSIPTACSVCPSSAFIPSRCTRCASRRTRGPICRFPLERAKRWHPLHRGIWVAGRVTLAGHLLQAKGDRVAMHSSVEVRYPFLDEEVFDVPCQAGPEVEAARFPRQASAASAGGALAAGVRLQAAQSDLPRAAGQLPHGSGATVRRPALERRILAPHGLFRRSRGASLAACFSPDAGGLAAASLRGGGLAAVVATQLWHHLYIDANLAELPESVSGAS